MTEEKPPTPQAQPRSQAGRLYAWLGGENRSTITERSPPTLIEFQSLQCAQVGNFRVAYLPPKAGRVNAGLGVPISNHISVAKINVPCL